MTSYPTQPTGNDCPPAPQKPAPQPPPPGSECDPQKVCTPPEDYSPPECPKCDPPCNCPPQSGDDPDCLQQVIDDAAAEVSKAEKAKAFKTELEAFQTKAKAAEQEYTQEKFDKLVKQWVEQDTDIALLIRKLVCALPCWRCIVECYVCRFLNTMEQAEARLYGDGKCHDTEFHNVYDERYWWERELDRRQTALQRIKNVLAVWEKPAQTIEKALADDAKLIADANKALGTDAPRVVFDVFFKLVPMHLAIGPPAPPYSPWTTKIGEEYTKFCCCDTGDPDACCGPDVGKPTLRQRFIGPQPYLVKPGDYFKVICCLVKERYVKAKNLAADADAEFQKRDQEIKRLKGQVDNGLKTFEKDAKGAIPSVVICCDDQLPSTQPKPQQAT